MHKERIIGFARGCVEMVRCCRVEWMMSSMVAWARNARFEGRSLTLEHLIGSAALAILAHLLNGRVELANALSQHVDGLESFRVFLLEKLEAFLFFQLLVLGFFARAAHGVVVLGALHSILGIETLRLGLDAVLARLAAGRQATRAQSMASVRVVALGIGCGVEHLVLPTRLAFDDRLLLLRGKIECAGRILGRGRRGGEEDGVGDVRRGAVHLVLRDHGLASELGTHFRGAGSRVSRLLRLLLLNAARETARRGLLLVLLLVEFIDGAVEETAARGAGRSARVVIAIV
jgi:hypothetical protein